MTNSTEADTTFLDELVQFAQEEKPDLAIRLLELNAMRADGDIDEVTFAERKAELYT